MAGHDRSPEWRHRATAPYPCLRETHNAAPTGVRKHLEPRSLVAPNISRSGCREGTNGQDECISRDDDRVFPEPSIRLSEVQIKLTNHERKLISRVRQNTWQNRCPNSPRPWVWGRRSVCPRRSRARLSRVGSTAGKTGAEDD